MTAVGVIWRRRHIKTRPGLLPICAMAAVPRSVPDVDAHIASFCSVAELVSLAGTDHIKRKAVSFAVKARYAMVLAPYFEMGDIQAFNFSLLQGGAALTGSAARWTMLPHPDWQPMDLNILARLGGAVIVVAFLREKGWKRAKDQNPILNQFTAASFQRFQKGELAITVTETKSSSVFRHCAQSSHTAGAVLLTPHSFLSFYPHHFQRNITIARTSAIIAHASAVSHIQRKKRLRAMGLTLYARTSIHREACHPSQCVGLPRRMRGGRGIGFFRWNATSSVVSDCLTQAVRHRFNDSECAFGWTFGACHNMHCRYFGFPDISV